MPFFHYRQNNSGGKFVRDNDVDKHVIIEADDAWRADERARDIGIYFDGVYRGLDCDCCGDRWRESDAYGGTPTPQIYGETIELALLPLQRRDYQNMVIHFADGTRLYGHYS